ncbi:MAG: hypothetical protein WA974_02275 [Thermodesulfobacteriota bacterium]
MPSTENGLSENRKIIYRATLHWAVLLGPTFLIFMGWLSVGSQGLPSVVLIAFGFIWGAFSTIRLRQSDILLTNNQLEINVGFPLKRSYTIPLDTITLTNCYQPSLGAILNFGKIMIVHNGTKKTVFRFIARPAEFVKKVQETIMTTRHHQQPSPSKIE